MPYNDYPIEECAAALEPLVAKGCKFYQKLTCEKCGDRVTGKNPNALHTEGYHEECGHTTDIRKSGCNYMLIGSTLAAQLAILNNTKR